MKTPTYADKKLAQRKASEIGQHISATLALSWPGFTDDFLRYETRAREDIKRLAEIYGFTVTDSDDAGA